MTAAEVRALAGLVGARGAAHASGLPLAMVLAAAPACGETGPDPMRCTGCGALRDGRSRTCSGCARVARSELQEAARTVLEAGLAGEAAVDVLARDRGVTHSAARTALAAARVTRAAA